MFDIQQKLKNIKNIEICSLMIGLIGTDRENIEVNEIKITDNEIRRLGLERRQGGTPSETVLITETGYLI